MNIRTLFHRFRRDRRSRRGTNAIEFALTAPVLFGIVLGTMDFGWMFCHQLLLDHVAFESARVASIAINDVDLNNFGQLGSRPWETRGDALWDAYGLPGDPEYTTQLLTTEGVLMVHVEAKVDYEGFFVAALPDELSAKSARRLENQTPNVDTP